MKCSIVISFIAVYLVIIIKILKSKVAIKIGHNHNNFRHFTEFQVVLEFSYIVFFYFSNFVSSKSFYLPLT